METLEVELGDNVSLKRNAVRNFQGRQVIVDHPEIGKKSGKIVESKNPVYFKFQTLRARIFKTEYTLPYDNLTSLQVINPNTGDPLRSRVGYHEVTQKTVQTTVEWVNKGYRA